MGKQSLYLGNAGRRTFFALRGRCFPFARGSPIKTMSSRLFRSPPWLFSMHLSKIRFK